MLRLRSVVFNWKKSRNEQFTCVCATQSPNRSDMPFDNYEIYYVPIVCTTLEPTILSSLLHQHEKWKNKKKGCHFLAFWPPGQWHKRNVEKFTVLLFLCFIDWIHIICSSNHLQMTSYQEIDDEDEWGENTFFISTIYLISLRVDISCVSTIRRNFLFLNGPLGMAKNHADTQRRRRKDGKLSIENALHSCFTGTPDLYRMCDQYESLHNAQHTQVVPCHWLNRNDKFLVAAKQHLDINETPETMEHLALGYWD